MKSLLQSLLLLLTGIAASMFARADDSIFSAGSEWETVGEGYNIVEGIAAAKDGMIYFTDVPDSELYRIEPSKTEIQVDKATGKANGLAFGPNGILYAACMAEPKIIGWNLKSYELLLHIKSEVYSEL